MNESETRAHYIDPALKAKGWETGASAHGGRIRAEFPITKGRLIGNGKREAAKSADYVLQYRGRNLAIIEAKADTLSYTEGVAQAKDYAERLQVRFTYSTNGKRIYAIDMVNGTEQEVFAYPTPEVLWAMTYPLHVIASEERAKQSDGDSFAPLGMTGAIDWEQLFYDVPFEDRGGTYQPRYYITNAVNNTLRAVARGQNRILLTMATGTGKTATAFQICWKLYHTRWNLKRDGSGLPRILFLADRNVLADQAFRSFSSFEKEALTRIKPSEIKKKGKVPTSGSIFFTIFQTFMSGGDGPVIASEERAKQSHQTDSFAPLGMTEETEDGTVGTPYFGDYPKDFFDFIIIDECHRGGAKDESTWRAILEYFSPAVQLGLTATPKRDVNGDTYAYFGEPVYTYSLKEGINDGFLSPFRVKEIDTTIDTYRFTPGDEVTVGEIDENKEYTEGDFNTRIQIEARERYRVKLFMDMMDQRQKTLVFCATQSHALLIRDLINQYATSRNPNYCHRVTANDGELGEQHLKEFQDNQRTIPTVLTTSQKLSTGVDAPEVRNIVLLRPVRSMVEFKQIVGRGTRLSDGKDYFTIYDFVEAHEHFNDPAWDGPPLPPEGPTGPPRPPRTCEECGNTPCTCRTPPPPVCEMCGHSPCTCEEETPRMVTVKLANGTERTLDHMVRTSFWDASGTPISADQFMQRLFGDLPTFFADEKELRDIWSRPDTRKKLLEELEERGYTGAQLTELQALVHGEDSDLYDVLSYVAYERELIPRLERADRAKVHFATYDPKQQEFLNFVLEQYVRSGVHELDDQKLPQLLDLRYKSVADAKAQLGPIPSIRNTFIGFQKWLYGDVG